jgi:thiol-disulfide isomerase/thioredoxin
MAAIAAVVLAAFVVAAGRDDGTSVRTPAAAAPDVVAPEAERQIAANAGQANRLIDGTIQDKLAQLKGVPVVVNQWASWCPSCQQEFPFFEQLARTYAGRVAFVGLDSRDDRGDAQSFLHGFPVSYPSVFDASAAQARSIGGGLGWPTTFFYDHTGRQTLIHRGGYTSLAALQADVQRYALGAASIELAAGHRAAAATLPEAGDSTGLA